MRQPRGRSQLRALTVLTRLIAVRCVYVHVCVCEEEMVVGAVAGEESGRVVGGESGRVVGGESWSVGRGELEGQ